jgi:chromosome partition protein MukE
MLVGQALALLYLDPTTVETGGVVTREHVLGHLAGVVGSDVLVRMMNPKRRRYDERVAAETVRSKVADALRRLSTLGFIDLVDESRYRLRASLLRFAEPLRGAGSPAAHLAELVASGEIVVEEEGATPVADDSDDDDDRSDDGERAEDEDDASPTGEASSIEERDTEDENDASPAGEATSTAENNAEEPAP